MVKPHDQFFKLAFGDPARATELLRLTLPGLALGRPPQRLGPLEAVPESFVSPKLLKSYSDLLFKTDLDQSPLFVYILFEHKSSSDASTLLQLLGYMTEIWRPFREDNASRLPHILPIVIYHGSASWNAPRGFSDYFEDASAFGSLDPEFRPLLLDLSEVSDDNLRHLSTVVRSAVHAFRWISRKQEPELRAALPDEVLALQTGPIEAYSTALLTYLGRESTPEEERAILDLVGSSPAREVFMTIAEKYILQGRSEGLKEGRTEGVLNGQRGMLVRQLDKKFGLSDEERLLIEHCDDLDRIAAAIDAFVDADSKEQVLARLKRQ